MRAIAALFFSAALLWQSSVAQEATKLITQDVNARQLFSSGMQIPDVLCKLREHIRRRPAASRPAAPDADSVGYVDPESVIANFADAQIAAQKFQMMEDQTKTLVSLANSGFKSLRSHGSTAAELQVYRTRKQAEIDEFDKKTSSEIEKTARDLESKIDKAIAAAAAEEHVKLTVFAKPKKSPFIDLTPAVIKRLQAAAPATP